MKTKRTSSSELTFTCYKYGKYGHIFFENRQNTAATSNSRYQTRRNIRSFRQNRGNRQSKITTELMIIKKPTKLMR